MHPSKIRTYFRLSLKKVRSYMWKFTVVKAMIFVSISVSLSVTYLARIHWLVYSQKVIVEYLCTIFSEISYPASEVNK